LLQSSFKQVKLEEEREILPSEIKQQTVFGNILTIDHMGVPNYYALLFRRRKMWFDIQLIYSINESRKLGSLELGFRCSPEYNN